MSPADIDRVFGRGRLRMVTGDHVEVFREEALPGERRRYTKRFLTTAAGDFRHWTEREWRILARLVGHGIGPVPDVVQFDRGARDRPALVQTYDAGITVDHWATLLPVARDGSVLHHVFEDCAHWWALARHALIALDAIHALQLVHLDLKADNICIPAGPIDFDPQRAGQLLQPRFDQIALIDFAFSLVSGESLGHALPIARQADYDYQSPRLLDALDAGRRGDLLPTRQLDWRCDIFSLAAMLRRYLPDPDAAPGGAWTAGRHGQARTLVRRLLEAHDGEKALQRPHAELIALTVAALDDALLAASLQRGWTLAVGADARGPVQPTPVTRIALPTPVTRIAWPLAMAGASRLTLPSGMAMGAPTAKASEMPIAVGRATSSEVPSAVPSAVPSMRPMAVSSTVPRELTSKLSTEAPGELPSARSSDLPRAAPTAPQAGYDVITLDPTDAAGRALAMPPHRRGAGRRTLWIAGSAAAAALAMPLLGEAWLALRGTEAGAGKSTPTRTSAARLAGRVAPVVLAAAAPPATASKEMGKAKETVVASGSRAAAVATHGAVRQSASTPPGEPVVAANPVPAPSARPSAQRDTAPSARLAHHAARRPSAPAAGARAGAPTWASARTHPSAPATARASASSAIVAAPAAERQASAFPAARPPSPVASAMPAPIARAEELPAPPRDFNARAEDLMAHHLPRIAQRAERLVLRVLFVAATADTPMQDAEVRSAASAIRLAPGDPALDGMAAVDDAKLLNDAARHAFFRRGKAREALALQTRAFGANPLNPEAVGNLAFLHLKQQPAEAEPARRLALHALTMNDARYPNGRLEDWTTLAIASALAGRERDARNAWLVTVALAPDLERQCRAAINAYATYGERLRASVESMLYRAHATGRAEGSALCEWPPHWSAGNQVR